MASILATGKVVAPVDVLVAMELLAPDKLADWRRGRVPYLGRRQSSACSDCRGRRHLR